jgi:hypothetical protein
VTPGQAANYVVTVVPEDGFNQKIAFACSGNPAASTCTVMPSSVTLDGSDNASVSVAVVTQSSSAGMVLPMSNSPGRGGSGLWMAMSSTLGIVGLLLVRRRRRYAGMALVYLFAVGLMPACGGSSNSGNGTGGGSSTQTGTYTIVVTGTYTSGSATLAHTANVTLVVK